MIYIEVINSTVSYIHYQPFDGVNGLNKSEDQLRQTGFLVESIPDPEEWAGFVSVLNYNQADGLYYRYDPCPESDLALDHDYDALVNSYIRERYTLSQELAMLRQQESKTDEYTAYFDYAEFCKIKAKTLIAQTKATL